MPTRDETWQPGTPNWLDLAVGDVEAAVRFYSQLFGWDVQEGPAEAGGYRMALLRGRPVAGIAPKMDPSEHTYWHTYLASDDADATAERIRAAGGTILIEPMDVPTFGRMLVAEDPNGAPFSVLQARDHIGAGIYNESGACIWNENLSNDPEKAKAFYGDVFGFTFQSFGQTRPGEVEYDVILREGGTTMDDCVGGLGDSSSSGGGDQWLTWFAVDDVDTSAVKVGELGGRVVTEPFDSPVGRMSIVAGLGAEVFGLLTPNPANASQRV